MKRHLILFILTILPGSIYTHADNLRSISSREGISNNSVLSLAQGQDGYIWFGTCDGLDMWDGDRAAAYPAEDTGMLPLSGNLIEEIICTKDSLFWIRTNYGLDLFGYNGVEERHEEFQGIYFVASRSSHETFIFAPENELYGYQPCTRSFEKISWPGRFSFRDILETSLSDENIAWIFCKSGIWYADASFPQDGKMASLGQAKPATGSMPLISAFRKDNGVYIIGQDKTLHFFNTCNGQITAIADLEDDINSYGPVSDISEYGDGYMISYLYNGVTRLSKTTTPGRNPDGYKRSRLDIDCGVFSLLHDKRQDIVWIGTDGQGVMMYSYNPTTFRSYTFDKLPHSLSKPVRALLVDSKGTLWMATKGEGILQIPGFANGGKITADRARLITTENSELADKSVYALAESRLGVIWIGSEGHGLNYYSYRSGKIHTLKGDIPESLKYIHGICEDGDTLWIATVGCGVFKLEIGTGASGPYVKKSSQINFGKRMRNMDMFFCVYMDSDGSLLFGNRGGGLAVYDPANGIRKVLKFNKGRSDIANDVWSICRSSQGDLWLGTSFGLLKVSLNDGTVEETSVRKSVHGILEGRYGELWVSTNRGLIKYIPANNKAITYAYNYGIGTIEYSDGAYFCDIQDSLLFFGGTNGFVTVDSRQDTGKTFFPDIQFTSVKYGEDDIQHRRNISRESILTVKANERLYEINADALDYIDGDNYLFYYMIKGFDRTWNSTAKTIKLPDLAPGKYTLLVKYYNPVNGYASPESSLTLRIKPKWYASVTAKTFYILLSVSLLWLASVYIRTYRRKKRQEQMEKLETKRKEELLDSTVQLFENIAQELTMPVTMISGPCQQILEYEKSDRFIRQHSEKILQQSGKLQSMLRMFQNFRESNDSELSRAQMFNVGDLAEEIARPFIRHAENRKVAFTRAVPQNLVWNTAYKEVATAMEMLLTDAFINVEKEGRVSLRVYSEDNMLKISVANDGTNSDPAKISEMLERLSTMEYAQSVNSSGLSFNSEMRIVVCKSIAAKLGGDLSVEAREGSIVLTFAVPTMKAQDSGPETASENYSSYMDLQDSNRIENAEMYREQLLDFDIVQERATMYIIGKDPEIMNFIAELFSSQYNIKMFNDCNAALYATHSMQPDIMIFEYMTQLNDVLNTIKAVKADKITANTPVLLLSGDRHADDNVKGIEAGADMYIGLPLDIKYLRASVEQLINKLKSLQNYYQSSIPVHIWQNAAQGRQGVHR